MNKELKDYTYGELIDYLTGRAIMDLGRGDSLKNIISYTANLSNMWTIEIQKKQAQEKRKKKK